MLSYRNITKGDCEFILQTWVGHSVVFSDTLKRDELLALIELWNTKKHNDDYFEMFAILNDGVLAGTFSLYQRERDIAEKAVSLGMEIAKQNRRKGFATNAVSMAEKIARDKGFKKIISQARVDNPASVYLHKKCGLELIEKTLDSKGNEVYNYKKEIAVSLLKAEISDSEQIHKMQVTVFLPLLQKYQDFETSPAAETLERVKERFNYSFITHFFILKNSEKIGSIRVRKLDKNIYKLVQIFILPQFQGKGYAQQAIKELETIFPNVQRWELDTIKQEQKLCYLYEKMGYVLTGKEKNIKENMDLVYYEKVINSKY